MSNKSLNEKNKKATEMSFPFFKKTELTDLDKVVMKKST